MIVRFLQPGRKCWQMSVLLYSTLETLSNDDELDDDDE